MTLLILVMRATPRSGPRVIRRTLEFFPEHIGVDFFVGVIAVSLFKAGTHSREELVDTVDDRRAGVEKQRAAAIQASMLSPTIRSESSKPKLPPPWRYSRASRSTR
jgi:hypothetical protein